MKLSIFKKLIREVIREELDYKFSRLEKKLDEVVVKSNINNINEDRTQAPQSTDFKKLMNGGNTAQSNVSAPKTKSSVLNDLLQETAESGEWKNINKEAETKSVKDNTQGLPDHLANALNKDYSQVLQKADEKSRMKNGA
jgi:predicted ATP-dependent endonuclease of OLD family